MRIQVSTALVLGQYQFIQVWTLLVCCFCSHRFLLLFFLSLVWHVARWFLCCHLGLSSLLWFWRKHSPCGHICLNKLCRLVFLYSFFILFFLKNRQEICLQKSLPFVCCQLCANLCDRLFLDRSLLQVRRLCLAEIIQACVALIPQWNLFFVIYDRFPVRATECTVAILSIILVYRPVYGNFGIFTLWRL